MRQLVLIIVLLFGSTAVGQQLKAITNSIGMKLVLVPAGTSLLALAGRRGGLGRIR